MRQFKVLARRVSGWGTIVVLVSSVTLNVVQANKLRGPGVFTGLKAGQSAPTLHLQTLDGRPAELSFTGKATILYYFSPQCGWCERNWLNVKALMASTDGRYRFVGISTVPDVGNYLRERRLTMETYTGVSLENARIYGLGATPHTVVVSEDGRIQYNWPGAYAGKQQTRVEDAFGLVLPGVATSASERVR
jgi:peroxiredoxin